MVVLYFVSACMLIMFHFSSNRYASANSNEDLDQSHDLKLAIRKIRELESLLKIQGGRISALEKRPSKEQWISMTNLQKTVQKQNNHISQLEARIYELEAKVKDVENKSVHTEAHGEVIDSKQSIIPSNVSLLRKGICHFIFTYSLLLARFLSFIKKIMFDSQKCIACYITLLIL